MSIFILIQVTAADGSTKMTYQVTVKIIDVSQGPLVVTIISPTTGDFLYVPQGIDPQDLMYTDRGFRVQVVPDLLLHAPYIMSANDDKKAHLQTYSLFD